jgi:predicted phosphodiesterase
MVNITDLLVRNDNETYVSYLKRIIKLVQEKTINYSEMGDLLLEDKNVYSSDNLRKSFYVLEKIVDNIEDDCVITDNDLIKVIEQKQQELNKDRVKFRDERNELNRVLREQARRESFIELVQRLLTEIKPNDLKYTDKEYVVSDNDLIAHLTDIHYGVDSDNYFNTFNEDELKKRLSKFLDKIFEIQKRHQSEKCYIIIGEIISGLIHNNLRIENNENVIEQFITVSTYISNLLEELSKEFSEVHVYVTAGNHSRVVANKNDSLAGENFDYLLPFYTRAKLQNYNNIFIHDNKIEPSIAMFNVRGNKVMSSHGDKDTPANVVQNFTMMFGIKPDICLLGHRHTNGLTTVFDSKVIESGCLSGVDNFALSIRKKNRPEQTISVITEDGLDCLYDVKLD